MSEFFLKLEKGNTEIKNNNDVNRLSGKWRQECVPVAIKWLENEELHGKVKEWNCLW